MPLLLKLNPDSAPVRFIEVEAGLDDAAQRNYIGPDRRAATTPHRSTGSA
ncbi:MAG: hypothetical protein M3Z30_11315 [Gemmatimonadota bacterium]|nr:hypothetical protein [Gemmatimonadota bacterium]